MKRYAGFTLVELMAVISIVSIMMAIGVPAYKYVTASNRMAGEVNGLLGDMQFARAEAIKQGSSVTVCRSADGTTCSATSTDWESGWIVFNDPTASKSVPNTQAILRLQKPFANRDTFTAENNIGAISFNREGFAMGLPGPVTITLHDPVPIASYTRCLYATIVGSIGTLTPASAAAVGVTCQ
jgi:type IV fimbrial biogenesis protein FimT